MRANVDYPRLPCLGPDLAVFLDFDGTLVDLADSPDAVHVDADLRQAIECARRRTAEGLAVVSGRPLGQLERLFDPLPLPMAGLHGLERLMPDRTRHREGAADAIRPAYERVRAALSIESGTRIEDKGATLAIHFRGAPERGGVILRIARRVLAELGPNYRLLQGADVVELLPVVANKGRAVYAFMSVAPYQGRRPVFVGDDVTDLDGFEATRRLGGFGIAVGSRVAAEYQLSGVAAVRRWLSERN